MNQLVARLAAGLPYKFVEGYNLAKCQSPFFCSCAGVPHAFLWSPSWTNPIEITCVTDLAAAWKKLEIPIENRVVLDSQARLLGLLGLRKDFEQAVAAKQESVYMLQSPDELVDLLVQLLKSSETGVTLIPKGTLTRSHNEHFSPIDMSRFPPDPRTLAKLRLFAEIDEGYKFS